MPKMELILLHSVKRMLEQIGTKLPHSYLTPSADLVGNNAVVKYIFLPFFINKKE